jgi:tetratricopeptide (TPR) repeat protein
MDRARAIYLLLGLLGSAAGCQVTGVDKLAPSSRSAGSNSGSLNTAELSTKEKAEACLEMAKELDKAAKDPETTALHAPEAIALYEKARQSGSQNPQISRRLAVLYDQQGDFIRALEEYKQLLKRSPKDADLLNDVGYCYYNQGNWVEAEKYLRQAVTVNAKHARAWINLGMTLAQTHRTAESLEAFTNVISPAQAQCNLAFILTAQKKLDDAKAAYRQALALEPDLALARNCLAKLEKAGLPGTAVAVPRRAPPNEEVVRARVEDHGPIEVPLP